MNESLTQTKHEHGIYTDFMEWLMLQQVLFETTRVGTDGSLYEKNTVEYGLTRGVIGEAQEALEEVQKIKAMEILTPDQEELIEETREHLKTELADILIFLASVFIHAGMTPVDVVRIAAEKMEKNERKYDPEYFQNRRVADALQYSRDFHAGLTPDQRIERRRASGHPMPSGGTLFREREEQTYSISASGSLN